MRTLLNEVKQIDDYLLNKTPPPEKLLFEARMIIYPGLKHQVMQQKQTLGLLQQYGRKTLRAEIEAVHQQLFALPRHKGFVQGIMRLFIKR